MGPSDCLFEALTYMHINISVFVCVNIIKKELHSLLTLVIDRIIIFTETD